MCLQLFSLCHSAGVIGAVTFLEVRSACETHRISSLLRQHRLCDMQCVRLCLLLVIVFVAFGTGCEETCPEVLGPEDFGADTNSTILANVTCTGSPSVRNPIWPGCDVEIVLTYDPLLVCFSELRLTVSVARGLFDLSNVELDQNTTDAIRNSLTQNSTSQSEGNDVFEWIYTNYSRPCSARPHVYLSFVLEAKSDVPSPESIDFHANITGLESSISGSHLYQRLLFAHARFVESDGNLEGPVNATTSRLQCESTTAFVNSLFRCYLRLRGNSNRPAFFKQVDPEKVAITSLDVSVTVEDDDGPYVVPDVYAVGNEWPITFTPLQGGKVVRLSAQYAGTKVGGVNGDVNIYVFEDCSVNSAHGGVVNAQPAIQCSPVAGVGVGLVWEGCSILTYLQYYTAGACFASLSVDVSLQSPYYTIGAIHVGANTTGGIASLYNGSAMIDDDAYRVIIPPYVLSDSSSPVLQLEMSLLPMATAPSHSIVTFNINVSEISSVFSSNVTYTRALLSVPIYHPRMAAPRVVDPSMSSVYCEAERLQAESIAPCVLKLYNSSGAMARYKSLDPDVFLTADDINITIVDINDHSVTISKFEVFKNEWRFNISIPSLIGSIRILASLRVNATWNDVGNEGDSLPSLSVYASCSRAVAPVAAGNLDVEWTMTCNGHLFEVRGVSSVACALNASVVYKTKFVCSQRLELSIEYPSGILFFDVAAFGNTTSTLLDAYAPPNSVHTGTDETSTVTAAFDEHTFSSSYAPQVAMSFRFLVVSHREDFPLVVTSDEIGSLGGFSLNESTTVLTALRDGEGIVDATRSNMSCIGGVVTAGEIYHCFIVLRDQYGFPGCCVSIYPRINVSLSSFNVAAVDQEGEKLTVAITNVSNSVVYFDVVTSSLAGLISISGSLSGIPIGGDGYALNETVYSNCSSDVWTVHKGVISKETRMQCGTSGVVSSNRFQPLCNVNFTIIYYQWFQCFHTLSVSVEIPVATFSIDYPSIGARTTNIISQPPTVVFSSNSDEVIVTLHDGKLVVSNYPVIELVFTAVILADPAVGALTVPVYVDEIDSTSVSRNHSTFDHFSVSVVDRPVEFFFGAVSVSSRQPKGNLSCKIWTENIRFQTPDRRSDGLWISPDVVAADDVVGAQFGCSARNLAARDLVSFALVFKNVGEYTLYNLKFRLTYESSVFVLPENDFVNVSYGNASLSIAATNAFSGGVVSVAADRLGFEGSGENVILVGITLQVSNTAPIAHVGGVAARVTFFTSSVDSLVNEAEFMLDGLIARVDAEMSDMTFEVDLDGTVVRSDEIVGSAAVSLFLSACTALRISLILPPLKVGLVIVKFPYVVSEVTSVNGSSSHVSMATASFSTELDGVVNSSLTEPIPRADGVYHLGSIYTNPEYAVGNATLLMTVLSPVIDGKNAHLDAADLIVDVAYGADDRHHADIVIPVVVKEPHLDLSTNVAVSAPMHSLQGEDTLDVTIDVGTAPSHDSIAFDTTLSLAIHKDIVVRGVSCAFVGADTCGNVYDVAFMNNELSQNQVGVTVFSQSDMIQGSRVALNVSLGVLTSIRPKTAFNVTALMAYSSTFSPCYEYSRKTYWSLSKIQSFSTLTPLLHNVTLSNSSNEFTLGWYVAFLESLVFEVTVYMPCVRTDLELMFELPFRWKHKYSNGSSLMKVFVTNVALADIDRDMRSSDILWGPCGDRGVEEDPDVVGDDWCSFVKPGFATLESSLVTKNSYVTNAVKIKLESVRHRKCRFGIDAGVGHGMIKFLIYGRVSGSGSDHSLMGRYGNVKVTMNYLSSIFNSQTYQDHVVSNGEKMFPLYAAEPDLTTSFTVDSYADAGDTVCYRLHVGPPEDKDRSLLPPFLVEIILTHTQHVDVFNWTEIVGSFNETSIEPIRTNYSMVFNVSVFESRDTFLLEYCGVVIQETPPGISLEDGLEIKYYNYPNETSGRLYEETDSVVVKVSPVILDVYICGSSLPDTDTVDLKHVSCYVLKSDVCCVI